MALISNSTLSTYPSTVDTFTRYQDAPHPDTDDEQFVPKAEIFNKIEAAIYRTQTHVQTTPRIVQGGGAGEDRFLTHYSESFTLSAERNGVVREITLPSRLVSLLHGDPFQSGNMLYGSCYTLTGNEADQVACRVWFEPVPPSTLRVYIDHLDPSRPLPARTYQLRVTFLGK